ncbi:hypothetical protein CLOM_g21091 [Closterium sp. NIES-68]|nr:hypothetical protein CLOM_g21091 [Closterium sp. NIES-68]GJP61596.1 hypothetical protein CLOP_g18739 [Closterium sp. NIES-67]
MKPLKTECVAKAYMNYKRCAGGKRSCKDGPIQEGGVRGDGREGEGLRREAGKHCNKASRGRCYALRA